jgi:hypothetical protein
MAPKCCCPACGHTFDPAPAVDPVRALELVCRERGFLVTPDGRVREDVAAQLLGLAAGTLRNWSYGETRLPYVRVARRRTYRLTDIAAQLAEK